MELKLHYKLCKVDDEPINRFRRRRIRLQCFPLYSILQSIGNPRVDIFSLDIEGGELDVLRTIPWKKVDISVLVIEVGITRQLYTGSTKHFIYVKNICSFSGLSFKFIRLE